ncbi:thiamine phosphate synthase [Helicobacter sp. 11S02596-1]|uniref:thiamine phosphate synthase n=1 Tax=Helicobacter sp. 11S02596-1 TaxID=1476194 RepID=UPI0031B9E1A4
MQGLYGISDEILTPYERIFELLESAIKGGLKIFQLRDKTHTDKEILDLAIALADFCSQNGVLFVINDRIDLAIESGAGGLHIGREDCALNEAKIRFKGKIGISCYDSLELAYKAQEDGADYVAFGAVFDSKTKPNAKKVSLDTIKKAKQTLKIPICAIGGIDTNNIHLLKDVEMVAVIGGLWKGNVARNARMMMEHWKED